MPVSKHNTLRNQMLFGFLLVMIVVLGGVALATFHSVSTLLRNNAEKNIQQTAIQANGRLEGILQQVDTLTTQVATNAYVQQLLMEETNGNMASFSDRQRLAPVINTVQIFGRGVQAVELYSFEGRRLYPLDGNHIQDKVQDAWIQQTIRGRGSLIWFRFDPKYPDSIMAIRLVKLMDQEFAPGGFLLVHLQRELFDLQHSPSSTETPSRMLLVDDEGVAIAVNDTELDQSAVRSILHSSGNAVEIDGVTHMVVRQPSEATGWTLLILTPISEIMSGISVLRTAILIAAGIGLLLYALLSFFLSTAITKPILQLKRTMRSARLGALKPVEETTSTIEMQELNRSYNEMVRDMNDLIRLVYEKEIIQSRMELKALQAQVNPHFLFNTMEALYRSLQERGELRLAEFVITISEYYRYTITSHNREEWVTLEEELAHIERYLQIMKLRLGDRLNWQIAYPEEHAHRMMPKLLIQPIVENAIVYGIEDKLGPGSIRVAADFREREQELLIEVTDNGAGMDEQTLEAVTAAIREGRHTSARGTGMGLANVERRIQLYAGSSNYAGGVRISSSKGEGTSVQIRIPCK
ncbi:sensor histidine kinase [Xylanibacillus composti]|uniref:histidine kinase n=1 Tax=Xylanibacillus composti TaxID=1572762 RepID=A0A8J4H2A4_9BACL|nr:sensor histidine kinase [Xylanibacillus composti]MDT9723883.1 sensor histidine kinase [Xylanibacillus composti]GIQ67338.1 histidine kinase [Xylanibacillus composti]